MTSIQTKPLAIEHRPLEWFKIDANELARHDDPEKVRLQGEDMLAKGQLQPVGATEDGRMIYGHGRYLSAKVVGIKTLEVKLFPASLSDTQFKLIRAAENLQRKELSGYRKWLLCRDLMSANPEWLVKDLTQQLHIDQSMGTRLLSPSKCILAWQEALGEGKVGISDCYAASKLGEAEQAELLRLKLSGASRDAIEQVGRRGRKGKSAKDEAGQVAKVHCELPTGVNITVSGKCLSLGTAIDALTDAIKEMKAAKASGYTAKTFAASMRDKAKARKEEEKAKAAETEAKG
jgi:ParB family chromosome partitioning protein